MKLFFALLFIVSLGFTQEIQIVVGSYTHFIGAKQEHAKLQEFIQNKPELQKFIQEKATKVNSKPFGEYFIITLEPFSNFQDIRFVFAHIKKEYPDAYTLKLSKRFEIPHDSFVDNDEPELKDLKVLASKVTIHKEDPSLKNVISQKQAFTPKQEFNLLDKYLIEIIAIIILLALVVIYFFIKTSQQKKKNEQPIYISEDRPKKKEKIPQEESKKPVAQKLENTVNEIETESLSGTEEGSFGVDHTDVHTVDVHKEQKSDLNPRTKKREVFPHAKITKANFQEFSGLRILVAEDNLINQKVINGLLADTGIELVMANDGKEALEILEKDKNFQFIFMDAHMPRIDGFEATKAIRANPDYEHILVVALSGDTAADDIKKMQNAGMQEHLEKPLRMDALYDILYAYTDPIAQDYAKVVMTSELNGDKGLQICGGDEAFYHEILDEFVRNYEDSAQKIHSFLEKNQIQQTDKLLLDILGLSANIGAERLHEIAKNLKDALQDVEESSYLTLVDQYEKHLHSLLEDIKSYK